jgi:asparagine synthase (glutamine-hydrolysing)
MCGLAGCFGRLTNNTTRDAVNRMLHIQGHRGPDSTGSWSGMVDGMDVAIGLSRLKILDLSDEANQPMSSSDGRYVIVYNGEIYNYLELRSELEREGVVFRTTGDTEVILNAVIRWGSEAFRRFNGMWALALVDRTAGILTLSRDRFGIKPLYLYSNDNALFIASEIKAILAVADTKFTVNAEAAGAFLQQNLLCTSNSTFFEGITEFPAGHWSSVRIGAAHAKKLEPCRYWTTPAERSRPVTETDLIEQVRATFIDSVRLRLRSDVPVGVLLSGGTDSSAIAGALNYLSRSQEVGNIKLISAVGPTGGGEEPFIDRMAVHLDHKVDKVQLDYSPSDTFTLLSEASWFNDEPIGSFSTVAHYLLMKRARDLGVTVLLSGQGSDEILCGYKKYLAFYIQELLMSGKLLAAASLIGRFAARGTVLRQMNYREGKRYLPTWLRLSETDIRGHALLDGRASVEVGLNRSGVIGRQALDLERLSVPALVHYEDRMSMAMAREIRLPFLDYRLVSLLLPLPVDYKLRHGWTKWIFRRAIQTLTPDEITWRKDKQHFIVPQNEWFKRELQSSVHQILSQEWVTQRLGLIDRQRMRIRYDSYLRQGVRNRKWSFKDIFAPLALEMWARRFEPYLR